MAERDSRNHDAEHDWDVGGEWGGARVLEILSEISRRGEPMTGPEVAEATSSSRATAYRVLEQLVESGWLSAGGRPRRFDVTMRVAQLGLWAMRGDRVHRVALSSAIGCARETGNRCSTAIYRDGYVLYLHGITATPQKVDVYELGRHYSALSQPAGKVILAFNEEATVMQAFERYERLTESGSRLDRSALVDEIVTARRSGYALRPAQGDEPASFAVPVLDASRSAVAAISVRLSDADLPAELIHRSIQIARSFAQSASAELGYTPQGAPGSHW